MIQKRGNRHHRAKSVGSEQEFFRLIGLSPDLAKFLSQVVDSPEVFWLMPDEKKREIESQMDAVLSRLR